ncbi:hypothetical protein Q8F55_004036 [Vanrija albida]|uniref:Uncharacterized protein n=1 Tax=Vanrija albida TaxID=181172 RepID=A0ABR3Q5L6_9TREE
MAIPPEDVPPPNGGSSAQPPPPSPPVASDRLAAAVPPPQAVEHVSAVDTLLKRDALRSVKGYSAVVAKPFLPIFVPPNPLRVQDGKIIGMPDLPADLPPSAAVMASKQLTQQLTDALESRNIRAVSITKFRRAKAKAPPRPTSEQPGPAPLAVTSYLNARLFSGPQRAAYYIPIPIDTDGNIIDEIPLPPGTRADEAARINANVAWAAQRVHKQNVSAVWTEGASDELNFVLIPVDRDGVPKDMSRLPSLRPADPADATQFNVALAATFGDKLGFVAARDASRVSSPSDSAPATSALPSSTQHPSLTWRSSEPLPPQQAEPQHVWIAVPVNEQGQPINTSQLPLPPSLSGYPAEKAAARRADIARQLEVGGSVAWIVHLEKTSAATGSKAVVNEVTHYVAVQVDRDGKPVGAPGLPNNLTPDKAAQVSARLLEDVRDSAQSSESRPSTQPRQDASLSLADSLNTPRFSREGLDFDPKLASRPPPPPGVGNVTWIPVPIGPDGKVVGTPRLPRNVSPIQAPDLHASIIEGLNRGANVKMVPAQPQMQQPSGTPQLVHWIAVPVDSDGKPTGLPHLPYRYPSAEDTKIRTTLAKELEGRASMTARLIADPATPPPAPAVPFFHRPPAPAPAPLADAEPTPQPATFHLAPPARHAAPAITPPKEKCLTWCSQQADAPAMCRMWCLRKRIDVPRTQTEALARLRPGGGEGVDDNKPASPAWTLADAVRAPFEALRVGISPYSIVYVKGTTEGVVGRYQEELEGDDGIYDFGPLSRHAPPDLARKSTGGFEWLDWGESGRMVHVPLLSVFGPVVNLPTNVEKVFGAPFRVAQANSGALSDGVHARMVSRMVEDIRNGGAIDILGKISNKWFPKNPTPTNNSIPPSEQGTASGNKTNSSKKEKEAEGKGE